MMRVYFVLFLMENLVREFVRDTLQEACGESWFEDCTNKTVREKVENRKDSDAKNGWHGGRGVEAILYLDFGDLKDIILKNWEHFRDLVPGQAWVSSRMDEAERSRNVIAHTNTLNEEESVRLDQHLRDWIRQIG